MQRRLPDSIPRPPRAAVLALAAALSLPAILASTPDGRPQPGREERSPAPGGTGPWKLGVVAQTDSRAEFRPCHCPGNPSGGLALRNGVIRRARSLPDPVVVVDGGDFAPDPDDSLAAEKAGFMIEAMERIGYDAVGLGELELVRGPEFLAEAAARLPLVCANLRSEVLGDAVPEVRWMDADGRRVAVTGFVDPLLYYDWPVALERDPSDLALLDPAETLIPLLARLRDEADAVVVLAHADLPTVDRLLGTSAEVDVVVHGHEPEAGRVPVPLGSGQLVEPGPRSRQVAFLTLRFLRGEPAEVEHYRLWDLKRGGRADEALDEMVRAFEERYGS